jgi:hypothetical protein
VSLVVKSVINGGEGGTGTSREQMTHGGCEGGLYYQWK